MGTKEIGHIYPRSCQSILRSSCELSTLSLLGTHKPVTSLALEEAALGGGAIYCLSVVSKSQWSLIKARKGLGSPLVPFIFLVVWTGAKGRISWCICGIFRVEQTIANLTFKVDERRKRSSALWALKSTHFTFFLTCRRLHGTWNLTFWHFSKTIPQVRSSLPLASTIASKFAFWPPCQFLVPGSSIACI